MSGATVIEVELLSGRYHAHVWGESQFGMAGPEWPPSPWRLLRTLAAAWFCTRPRLSSESARDRLLEMLARSGPPELWLPRASVHELRYYQPVRLGASDRVLHHDHFAVPEGGRFWFRFAIALDDAQRGLLDSLLAHICYFGRAESRALIRRQGEIDELPRGVHRVVARNGDKSSSSVVFKRVLGTTSDFEAADLWSVDGPDEGAENACPQHLVDTLLSRKMPLPEGARWIDYALPASALVHEIRPHAQLPEPAGEVQIAEIHFRLSRRIPVPLRQLVAVSRAFREAVVAAHHQISPTCHSRTLTGREADNSVARGNQHAYYLPLFGAAGPTIDTLMVRIPTGVLTRAEYDALLAVHRIQVSGRAYPITVTCERIVPTGEESKPGILARRWRSMTPFLPPLHRRRGRDSTSPEAQIAKCVEGTYGQRPQSVRLMPCRVGTGSVTSLLAHEYVRGQVDRNCRRWKLTRRLGFWFELAFAEPVVLDVPIGSDAHFGAGHFVPVDEDSPALEAVN